KTQKTALYRLCNSVALNGFTYRLVRNSWCLSALGNQAAIFQCHYNSLPSFIPPHGCTTENFLQNVTKSRQNVNDFLTDPFGKDASTPVSKTESSWPSLTTWLLPNLVSRVGCYPETSVIYRPDILGSIDSIVVY
ncbi:hypothetical protein ACROYT_G036371, partial [Oculina patagonica]